MLVAAGRPLPSEEAAASATVVAGFCRDSDSDRDRDGRCSESDSEYRTSGTNRVSHGDRDRDWRHSGWPRDWQARARAASLSEAEIRVRA